MLGLSSPATDGALRLEILSHASLLHKELCFSIARCSVAIRPRCHITTIELVRHRKGSQTSVFSSVQFCFTSLCGQVQPLDVAFSRGSSCGYWSRQLAVDAGLGSLRSLTDSGSQVVSAQWTGRKPARCRARPGSPSPAGSLCCLTTGTHVVNAGSN